MYIYQLGTGECTHKAKPVGVFTDMKIRRLMIMNGFYIRTYLMAEIFVEI